MLGQKIKLVNTFIVEQVGPVHWIRTSFRMVHLSLFA